MSAFQILKNWTLQKLEDLPQKGMKSKKNANMFHWTARREHSLWKRNPSIHHYEKFPEPHLSSHQPHILGELLDFLFWEDLEP